MPAAEARSVCLTDVCSNQLLGTTTLPNVCRAGGNGPYDYVCEGVSEAFVTLVKYPEVLPSLQ
jgi:hypothetical protein